MACEFRAIAKAGINEPRDSLAKRNARIGMAILATKRPAKLTYERGVLACGKCAAPIYVYKLKKLLDEFSVRCPRCGERGIYAKSVLTIESLRERRKKPRD